MEKFKEEYTCDATLLFIVDKGFSEIKVLREIFPGIQFISVHSIHAFCVIKILITQQYHTKGDYT